MTELVEHFMLETRQKAEELLRDGGPDSLKIFESENHKIIRTKWHDHFNFVDTTTVTFDGEMQKLLGVTCTCRQDEGFCRHSAATLLSLQIYNKCALLEEAEENPEPPKVEGEKNAEFLKVEAEEPDDTDTDNECEEFSEELRSMEILFGYQPSGEEVIWRPNDTEQVFHTNTGIIGTMGTGKTQFTKSLVAQVVRQMSNNYDGSDLGILIFDYKGDYNETKEDFVRATHARILKPFRLPYNPLALHRAKSFKPLLPMHVANTFKDTIAQIYNLGPKQQQNLLDCLIEAYEKQGISPANPMTWNKKAPTFDQVYAVYVERFGSKTPDSLTAAMNKLHQFCIFSDDPNKVYPLQTLLKGVVVIDLSGYTEDIQSLVVAITLDLFYAQMQQIGSGKTDGRLRQLRTLILVDEADNFMRQKFPSLRKIMKEGREFGVGVLLSTQSLTHFHVEEDYSRYVLTWVVHNVNDLKQRDVEYIFRLPVKSEEAAARYDQIKALEKHESLIKISNGDPVLVRDRAFWQLLRDSSASRQ